MFHYSITNVKDCNTLYYKLEIQSIGRNRRDPGYLKMILCFILFMLTVRCKWYIEHVPLIWQCYFLHKSNRISVWNISIRNVIANYKKLPWIFYSFVLASRDELMQEWHQTQERNNQKRFLLKIIFLWRWIVSDCLSFRHFHDSDDLVFIQWSMLKKRLLIIILSWST